MAVQLGLRKRGVCELAVDPRMGGRDRLVQMCQSCGCDGQPCRTALRFAEEGQQPLGGEQLDFKDAVAQRKYQRLSHLIKRLL